MYKVGQSVMVTTKHGNRFDAVIESITPAGDTGWSDINDLFDPPTENQYTVVYSTVYETRRQVVPESWLTLIT